MFCCIYVPNFLVAAALRAEPELQARAVAIVEGKPPLEKIIAVNEKAGCLGIAPGMTKAQAELCAELTLRLRSRQQESAAHAALLDCARSFSPCVEDTADDTVLVDLAGMGTLFGSLPEISHAISKRAAELGLTANVATAANPDAALVAARGFPGVTVIPSGQEAEILGSLPVKVLFADRLQEEKAGRPTPSTHPVRSGQALRGFRRVGGDSTGEQNQQEHDSLLETLDRWGTHNLRALAALPEVALSERLGQEGLRLQQLARGAAARTLVSLEAPLVFEEAVELEHPIVLLEPLAFLLNRLLEQICARLGSRALATQELRLTLELSNLTGITDEFDNMGIASESDESSAERQRGFPPDSRGRLSPHDLCQTKFVRTLTLPLPMLDPKIFLKLLQLDLSAYPPGAPITKIHLAAEPARPRPGQAGLFVPPSPEPEKLELTLARIAGMVGEHKVGAVELLDTHHPEGFRMRSFATEIAQISSAKNSDSVRADSTAAESAVTALRRFRPPLRAHVKLEDGQPAHLVCRKKEVQGCVLWKAGPWRFSGDWWEREAWARDEWDIALRNKDTLALYRLVHDRLGGGWFVEGTYD
jgi:protein ImuB